MFLPAVALLATLAFGGGHSARAAQDAWATNASTGSFVANNWKTGTATPGAANGTVASGDQIFFGTSTVTTLTDDEAAGFSFGAIGFNAGAAAFTIGGTNGMTVTGGISNGSTNLQTINDPIAFPTTHTVTTTAGGGDLVFGGILSGSGTAGLTVAGGGTLTLGATGNSYPGITSVSAGTLLVNGSTPAGSTVSVTGMLGGSGTVGSPTTVNSAGSITGGTNGTTGTLTLSNTLAINGTYAADIGTSGASDRLTIAGVLTLGSASVLTLSTTTLDGSSFVLASYSSVSGTFHTTNVPASYQLVYGTTQLLLSPIPEPGTWALVSVGLGLLVWAQRRRRWQVS